MPRPAPRAPHFTLIILFLAGLTAWAGPVPDYPGEYFRPALARVLEEAKSADSPALALSALQRMGGLASESGTPPWAVEALENWLDTGCDSLVAPAVRDYLARQYLRQGDLQQAKQVLAPLNLVGTWYLNGPHLNSEAGGDPKDHPWPAEQNLNVLLKSPSAFHRLDRPAQRSGLNLTPFLWPDEEVTLYLVTSFQAPKAGPAALRLATLSTYKAWLNGEEVGSFTGSRPSRIDQDSWGVNLLKGVNTLMIKVVVKENGGVIRARLTDPQGGDLDLTMLGELPATTRKAKGRTAPEIRTLLTGVPLGEEVMSLEEALAHIALGDLSEEDTRPKEALSKHLENHPDQGALKFLRARQESSTTGYYQYMEEAAEAGSVQARLAMARYRGNWGNPLVKAFEVKELLADYPEDPVLLAEYHLVRARTQESSRAQRDLEALTKKHGDVYAVVEALHQALGSSERFRSFLEVGEALLQLDQGRSSLRSDLAQNYWVEGRQEKALTLLEEGLELFPLSGTLARSKAELLSGSGRYMDAMAVWDELLELCPSHFEALREKGYCLLALKRDEEGRKFLRASLEELPQQQVLKRYLDRLEDAPPVPGQRALWAQDGIPPKVDRNNSEEAVVLLDHQIVEVFDSGLTERTVEMAVQVFGEGGVSQYRTISLGHDPLRESLRVLRMEIHRPDGTVIPGRLRRGGRVNDRANNLYYDYVASYITFPDLRKGDRIYYRYVLRDTETRNSYGKYFGLMDFFAVNHRTLRKGLEIWMPKDRELHHRTVRMDLKPDIRTVEQWKVFSWEAADMRLEQREAHMPGPGDTAPYVHVGTFRDWTDLGRWYQNFIQAQIHLGEAEARKARSMVSQASTTREKVAILHDYVVKKTRYVGLEFGVHGYLPYSCQTVLTRGFGDCKDKANLLVSLLEEVGVDAHMVLIRTRRLGAIETEPASLSVFNHAIAYVPELDLFLDGTAEHSGMEELPWQDQGAEVLIVPREDTPYLATTPIYPADHNSGHHQYKLTLDNQGDGRGSLQMDIAGDAVPGMRRTYLSQDKRHEKLAKWMSRLYPGATAEQVETSDPEDLSVDFFLRAEGVSLPGFGRREGGSLRLPVSVRQPELGGTFTSLGSRKQDLDLGAPFRHRETITLELPEGTFTTPLETVELDSPYGSLRVTHRLQGTTLTTEVDLRITAHRVEASEYQAFADFARAVDRALEPHLFYELETTP